MRIGVIGFGRMGKAVEKAALERGHSVVSIDPVEPSANFKEITSECLSNVDVCIDFTNPLVVFDNVKKISALRKNLVIGTTGWYAREAEMKELVKNIGCIWSGNFSIGMNVFFHAVKETAKLMNNLPEYDAAVFEVHHNQKKDSPGGSAQMIGRIILDEMHRKKKIVADRFAERKPDPDELHVASVRCGSVPGTHTVLFDCPVDSIELKHVARGREGFAFGAVLAAEFILNKKGFFGINDLMDEFINKK